MNNIIPNYHYVQCCRTCKYWSERLDDNLDPDFQSICKKFLRDIQDYAICNSYEKSIFFFEKSEVGNTVRSMTDE